MFRGAEIVRLRIMQTEFQHIDEARIGTDLAYRFGFVSAFIGYTQADIDAVHASAEHLAPVVGGLVDAVYDKLFSYDCTKRHFVPRQAGYDGDVPVDLASLTHDHDQIAFRKQHLQKYLVRLVTEPHDGKLLKYLDAVGRIHTPKSGSDRIAVPLWQMNALMGFVSDAVIATVMGLTIDLDQRIAIARAFNKLLWIQQDLIQRWYVDE